MIKNKKNARAMLEKTMRPVICTLILTFYCLINYSQTSDFHKVWLNPIKETKGKMKGFDSYDLKTFNLLVGWENKELKALIKSKVSDEIKFKFDETTDAMIIKPVFYENSDKKIMVIMLELAAEYSWGQKIVMIKNNNVYDCGFLDFMTNENNGESIAKYAILRQINGQIVLTFQPQDFVDKDEKIVKSQTLKYLLTDKGLKQTK